MRVGGTSNAWASFRMAPSITRVLTRRTELPKIEIDHVKHRTDDFLARCDTKPATFEAAVSGSLGRFGTLS